MEYILITTQNGYEQLPVQGEVTYQGKEYRIKELEANRWGNTDSGEQVMYMPDSPRRFEHQGKIAVMKKDGDINIPDMDYIVSIEDGRFKVFGNASEGLLFLNRKKLDNADMDLEYTLAAGDLILIENVLIIYYDGFVDVFSDMDKTEVLLPECDAVKTPFDGFPHFTRSPRLIMHAPDKKVEINHPPAEASMPKGSLVQTIVPPVIMLCITIVIAIVMNRGIFVLMSIASTLMTLFFSITGYINDKKECREKNKARSDLYMDYLLRKRKELNELYQEEERAYHYNYPDIADIEKMTGSYSSRIYERSAEDDDFLEISLGKRREKASFSVRYQDDELKMEEDELDKKAKLLAEKFSYIDDKAVTVSLKNAHLGLVGEKDIIIDQLKLIVAQLTFQQSYHDLQIILIHNKKYNDEFRWMRWYPHLTIKSLNMSGDINSEQMRDQVLGSLFQILKDRKLKVEESNKQSRFLPHFVFIIDEPKLIMDHSIMEYLNKSGRDLGFSVIYTSYLRGNLPEIIGTVVEIHDSEEADLLLNENKVVNKRFRLNHVGDCNLEWMARNLSVLVHDQGVTSKIPESITFFEMYGVKKPEEFHSEERWGKNQSHKSLAVPLGVRAEDDIVFLNLHEKAHGPHGLVAGTTGSGKSEIIQSYILSLAVNFHPYEVGFLLIDYKGGGMAGLFRDLPHLLGTITNLDGSESKRAMASIKSELARRQRIFGQYNVNHINSYNKLYKNGEVQEPIPHLFLISDEFAELKKEQPDFMTELVSTARIGRSLGIHLILATQKPTGVVNDQIWTNSKFKLALKVQDEADSREIIKTPDAAYITQAGRAYLQVGNNEIYELFQSAWSGAEFVEDGAKKTKDNRVYLLNDLGQGELLNEDLSGAGEDGGIKATQLDVTIDYLKKLFEEEGVEKVKRPWLPSLLQVLVSPLSTVTDNEGWNEIQPYDKTIHINLTIPFGMIDIPEEQLQKEYSVNLAKEGNIVFMSSAGYGKTMFLMTAVLSLALQNQVESLNFYILDFGNSALIPLNAMPHTADYILYDDMEKLGKFINIIQDEVALRKKLFAEKMVQNFTVYNQTNDEPLKAVVIVVDNFDVVRELGPDVEEFFTKLSRDGAGLGIYMIITATRVSGVKYSILNNFKIKLAGYLFDSTEASALVGKSEYKLPEIRGRALVKTLNVNIMQIYTMVKFGSDIEYNRKIKELIQKISDKYPDRRAPRIPVLPEQFRYEMLPDYADGREHFDLAVGLEAESVTKAGFTCMQSPFVIIGETGRGKTNMVKVLLNQILAYGSAYVFDSASMELHSYQDMEGITYVQDEEEFEDFVDCMKQLTADRKLRCKQELDKNGAITASAYYRTEKPVYIVIDDMDKFMTFGSAFAEELHGIMTDAAECGVGIIITVHSAKLKGFDTLSKWVKAASHGLVLSPQGTLNIFPVRSQREYPQMGRGLLFHNGEYITVQLPECKG
ncbi:MAG: type VII secretion protein EssC [Lachnospiraceae bacterium]|nr:type VII secretion protein EssC [Lachnospiraceae bacterium]